MEIMVTEEQILHLAPNVRSAYLEAFKFSWKETAHQYEIDTPLRVAHFMAQILHESGGFSVLYENLNYSAKRLPVVWPSRFLPKGPNTPEKFAYKPEELANLVYGGRMGNTEPGDGWKYRGRGLIQLTGKAQYKRITDLLMATGQYISSDLVRYPELVVSPMRCLAVAAVFWKDVGCNEAADQDDLTGVTKRINGGTVGLQARASWLARTKQIWS